MAACSKQNRKGVTQATCTHKSDTPIKEKGGSHTARVSAAAQSKAGLYRFFELLSSVSRLKRGDNIAQQIAHQHTVVG